LVELQRRTEEKKAELEAELDNVVLRESLAISNERYVKLKSEQDEVLTRMRIQFTENEKTIERVLVETLESMNRSNTTLAETVAREVSSVNAGAKKAMGEMEKAMTEAAQTYQRLFVESQKRYAQAMSKLLGRRNLIDSLVIVLVVIVIALLVGGSILWKRL